ncbi:MAG TPA: hypothetical protein VHK69_08195 [Chitinophagaceae bacterium]|jgi:hypothetical protein|nr:hypothetical protein [Chitinophagaceae bacterium]
MRSTGESFPKDVLSGKEEAAREKGFIPEVTAKQRDGKDEPANREYSGRVTKRSETPIIIPIPYAYIHISDYTGKAATTGSKLSGGFPDQ